VKLFHNLPYLCLL